MPIRLPAPLLALSFLTAATASAQMPMTAADSARHVLERLSYGGTPGEVENVTRTGVMKWIDQQLGYSDVHDPALEDTERYYDVLRTPVADMVAMQNDQQLKQQKAQAVADSTGREAALAAIRQEQQASKKGLQFLLAGLNAVTVVRAAESQRQLDEIMVDFWTNHFNVYENKSQDRSYFADYLERTIRGNALGKFEDLLIATARSPAMLFYLDNAQSVAAGTGVAGGRGRGGMVVRPGLGRGRAALFPPPRAGTYPPLGAGDPMDSASAERARKAAANAPRGLNENYARELMELHTLGVDGGYTQQDVINVARILTGWTIDRKNGSFLFRPGAHDQGEKVVLGEVFPAGHGEDEGIRLLKMLATNPATIHHVSSQLCERFVADAAPDGCIDDAVHAWERTGGDIREVVRAIVRSPDFWAPANVDSKVKTPLEFVISAMRAVDGVPDSTPRMAQQVGRLGEPLFQKQTPDGYGERQEDWVNSGALLARMNFAVALASGRMPGVTVDLDKLVPLTEDHVSLVSEVSDAVLGGAMTKQTRETILKELADVPNARAARALAVGFAIGGPEFQRQ
ncbi:MAG TPA: DUF1800 domain-containing protein [Gemmatimonadales bacterium]|jgi:uncharacterized protein (DUF1800 family)|nr:DUF1800 domain-containing protein [Gemmatimonadales bacterium]